MQRRALALLLKILLRPRPAALPDRGNGPPRPLLVLVVVLAEAVVVAGRGALAAAEVGEDLVLECLRLACAFSEIEARVRADRDRLIAHSGLVRVS